MNVSVADVEVDEVCAKRIGTVLCEKWTLERLVGVGGMAAVYVARHKIGRLDAIKILHPELARAEQVRARFEQEAHVLNRFEHPGAVEVRDLEVSEDGAPFIVMELLDGRSLAETLRASASTVDETLRVADEVLDVLAAAHEKGIIHRDIKPDNLFVTRAGPIKVLDFGIAQLRGGAGDLKTKTGATLGTVAYMPPEQLKGVDIDVRADVYGVAATLFRMLTGAAPHRADSDVELMMKVLSEPAPRLATVVPNVRADVAAIVDRGLAFDRDARFASARAMQDAVRAARANPSPEIALPLPPQSEVATVTPHRLSPAALAPSADSPALPAPAVSSPGVPASPLGPTMVAAPESALLRAPASQLPTRAVSQPGALERTRASGAEVAPSEQRIVGVPLMWVIVAGAVALVAAVVFVAMVAFVASRRATPDPSSTVAARPSVAPAAPPAPSMPTADPDDEPHPPEPHHPPPHGHGHGKHKP